MPQPNPEPTSLTDRGIKSITDYTEQIVKQGLQDFGSAAGDLPAFLAGPTPDTVAALPLYGIARQACRTWARGFGPQQLPGFDFAWSGICTPYLESIGEDPDPGKLAPPFLGGQCPALYRVRANLRSFSTGAPNPNNPVTIATNFPGPLQLEVNNAPPPQCPPGSTWYQVRRMRSLANNNTVSIVGQGCGMFDPLISVTVERMDGQPDNCGNSPPQYTGPRQAPALPPLTPAPIQIPGVGPVAVDVTFGPDGEINISLPDLGIDFSTGNPFDPEADSGGGSTPTTPGESGGAANTGAGGEASGTAPEGSELTGVLVAILDAPGSSNKFDNVSADVFRGVGYVAMGYPGLLGLDTSAAVFESPQFFHAQQRGLTSWRVRANVGFSLSATPYYREVTP